MILTIEEGFLPTNREGLFANFSSEQLHCIRKVRGSDLGDCKRAPDAGGGVLRVLGVQHEVQAAGERQATYHHRPQERETTYLPQV